MDTHMPPSHLAVHGLPVADGSLSAATNMPPAMYHDDEILTLERDRVFARDWVSPGLAAEIPKPGDRLTWSIADRPVFCVRGADGLIRTFSNVCRHRMMTCLLYTSPSPRDKRQSRMPSSA